jgi:hypothetical protein
MAAVYLSRALWGGLLSGQISGACTIKHYRFIIYIESTDKLVYLLLPVSFGGLDKQNKVAHYIICSVDSMTILKMTLLIMALLIMTLLIITLLLMILLLMTLLIMTLLTMCSLITCSLIMALLITTILSF